MALLDNHLIKHKHSSRWLLFFCAFQVGIYLAIRWFFRMDCLASQENGWNLDYYVFQVLMHSAIATILLAIYCSWKGYDDLIVPSIVTFLFIAISVCFWHWILDLFIRIFFSFVQGGIEDNSLAQLLWIRQHFEFDTQHCRQHLQYSKLLVLVSSAPLSPSIF